MPTPSQQPPHDAVNWFEIPTTDLERAVGFYQQLLDTTLKVSFFGEPMALFPSAQEGVGGALVHRPRHQPANAGALVYLNADGRLDAALARTEEIGGKVLVPSTPVPGGFGSFAVVLDTEGNHIGLHAHAHEPRPIP